MTTHIPYGDNRDGWWSKGARAVVIDAEQGMVCEQCGVRAEDRPSGIMFMLVRASDHALLTGVLCGPCKDKEAYDIEKSMKDSLSTSASATPYAAIEHLEGQLRRAKADIAEYKWRLREKNGHSRDCMCEECCV